MTYEYVENQVLKLLNQYTMAGESVAETYNNQKDYIRGEVTKICEKYPLYK